AAAVRGRRVPGEADAVRASGRAGERGCTGYCRGRRGARAALVGACAFADSVQRGDLVIVGRACDQAGVGVARHVAERRQQVLGAARGAAVEAVGGDRAAAGRGRGGPTAGEGSGACCGGGGGEGGWAGCWRGGRGTGDALVGACAFADRVQRGDLVVVGHARGDARVGVARHVAERRDERLGAAGGAAVEAVAGDRAAAVRG